MNDLFRSLAGLFLALAPAFAGFAAEPTGRTASASSPRPGGIEEGGASEHRATHRCGGSSCRWGRRGR